MPRFHLFQWDMCRLRTKTGNKHGEFPVYFPLSGKLAETGLLHTASTAMQTQRPHPGPFCLPVTGGLAEPTRVRAEQRAAVRDSACVAGDPAGARANGSKNPNVHGCTGAAKHRDVRERPMYKDVQVPRSTGMCGSGQCTWMYRCREAQGCAGAANVHGCTGAARHKDVREWPPSPPSSLVSGGPHRFNLLTIGNTNGEFCCVHPYNSRIHQRANPMPECWFCLS